MFVLDISYAFYHNIPPNPKENVYLSLPPIYLEWSKIKRLKHPLESTNKKELCIQSIKSIQGKKTAGKL